MLDTMTVSSKIINRNDYFPSVTPCNWMIPVIVSISKIGHIQFSLLFTVENNLYWAFKDSHFKSF